MTIDYCGPVICKCGIPGCIEGIASGRALGDNLDQIATRLSAWLGGVVSILDPDIIVIGGGVSQIAAPLFDRLKAEVPKWTINPFAAETPIVPARFDSGILGAASLWL